MPYAIQLRKKIYQNSLSKSMRADMITVSYGGENTGHIQEELMLLPKARNQASVFNREEKYKLAGALEVMLDFLFVLSNQETWLLEMLYLSSTQVTDVIHRGFLHQEISGCFIQVRLSALVVPSSSLFPKSAVVKCSALLISEALKVSRKIIKNEQPDTVTSQTNWIFPWN